MTTLSPALSICVNVGIVLVIWRGRVYSHPWSAPPSVNCGITNYLQNTIWTADHYVHAANVWAAGSASSERDPRSFPNRPEVQEPARRWVARNHAKSHHFWRTSAFISMAPVQKMFGWSECGG